MSAQLLVEQGHKVVLHARNESRAEAALRRVPGAETAIVGDLATLGGMHEAARRANALGRFDAVIHNAGVGYTKPKPVVTEDGLEQHFAVNVLAPYVLTGLMTRPDRLVFVGSGLHRGGRADLTDSQGGSRPWSGIQAYSDSKLQVTALALHVARMWPDVRSNALEPGWVATKMGGPGAPDDLSLAPVTQVWLAVSDDPAANVTGGYFYHQQPADLHPAARDAAYGTEIAALCADSSGITLTR
jgi:NAD(P)-dependent dehydrogenase (short-subunit alcohol dehydrogenase family)